MTFRKTLIGGATIAALFAAPLAPAFAQQTGDSAPAGAPMLQEDQTKAKEAASFTDDQLQGFVEASNAVSDIRLDYMPKLQAATDEAEATELQMQAMTEMQEAVDGTENMDVDLYNQIGRAMQSNPEVEERIAALVQSMESAPADTTSQTDPQGQG